MACGRCAVLQAAVRMMGEEALAIDSFRVYASALGILEQKAQEAGARLTFADIKGPERLGGRCGEGSGFQQDRDAQPTA